LGAVPAPMVIIRIGSSVVRPYTVSVHHPYTHHLSHIMH
jgi:hypothetical protein